MLSGFPDPRRMVLTALAVIGLSAAAGVGLGYALSELRGGAPAAVPAITPADGGFDPAPAGGATGAAGSPGLPVTSCLRARPLVGRAGAAGGPKDPTIRICLDAGVGR